MQMSTPSELDDSVVNGVADAITGLCKVLRRGMSEVSLSNGLDAAGVVLLANLGRSSHTIGSLAKVVHSDASTVSRQVSHLTDLGLVAKQPDEQDRRVTSLELTDAGQRAWDEVKALRNTWFREALGDFTDQEASTLAELADRLLVSVRTDLDAACTGSHQPSRTTQHSSPDHPERHL